MGVIVFGLFSAKAQAQTDQKVANAINQFAFDLYKMNSKQSGNLFFSPLSIEAALAMTSAGAEEETLLQMQKTLRLSGLEHKDFKNILDQLKGNQNFQLVVANRIWGQSGNQYDEKFLKILQENYSADLSPLDFKQAADPSREKINQWVAENTQQKIKDLLQPGTITPQTDLVLTNAIYFKGQWYSTFEKSNTKPDPFFMTGGKTKKVPFMTLQKRMSYYFDDQMQIVELPYKGGELVMSLILPNKDVPLAKVETVDVLKNLGKLSSREVICTIPKFKIESKFDLNENLSQMGMPLAFDKNKANFKGIRKMIPGENLFISKVVHKAFVDVDENGTEAAAATAVVMMPTSAMMPAGPPAVFKADHPFLFLIRHHRTGAILFMGRVSEP